MSSEPYETSAPAPGPGPEPAWWREAVVYQIYPRSFADSDGDGIGDLRGILGRLDHLAALGVDVLWLSPVYPSPQDDNGYDISDYRGIDPVFGTLDDFDALLAAVHARGMRLIMDLVVNHTSDEHPWFRASREGGPHGPMRDWYLWREPRAGRRPGERGAEPNNWGSWFSGPAWTWDEVAGAYYLHLFSPKQPDLNWDNAEVRHAVHDIVRWWLARGVDGFRMDVVNFVSKDPALPDGVVPEGAAHGDGSPYFVCGPRAHEYLAELHREVFAPHPRTLLTVGEMPGVTMEQARLFTDPARAELDMVFQFEHVGLDQGPGGKFDPVPLRLTELKASLARWQEGIGAGWNSLYCRKLTCDNALPHSQLMSTQPGTTTGSSHPDFMRGLGPEWEDRDTRELSTLIDFQRALPVSAPRALISIRLSVLTEETTSPVRQELDLWKEANRKGYRVIGVARDLNVSATKIPPWKRKKLGDWLNNRSPEFDVIMFWKLDRFVRRIFDLHVMIEWCKEWDKDLVSLKDPIDLHSEIGKVIVTLIAGFARIETANTTLRIQSLWAYQKRSTSRRIFLGKPTYGYRMAGTPGDKYLVIDERENKALHWARRLMAKGNSRGRVIQLWTRAGFLPRSGKPWTSTVFYRIMSNPALMGYRVTREGLPNTATPSTIVRDPEGNPIVVADPIFTPDEFDEVQSYLARGKRPPRNRATKKVTYFIGVLTCPHCEKSPRRNIVNKKPKEGRGLEIYDLIFCGKPKRTEKCPRVLSRNGEGTYAAVARAAYDKVGDLPVEYRTYRRGKEVRQNIERLEAALDQYMKDLERGGRYAVGGYVQKQAEEKMQNLNKELLAIDPEEAEDRWVYERKGDITYRQRWERDGIDAMEEDLLRSGIKFHMYSEDHIEMILPGNIKKLKEALAIRENTFVVK